LRSKKGSISEVAESGSAQSPSDSASAANKKAPPRRRSRSKKGSFSEGGGGVFSPTSGEVANIFDFAASDSTGITTFPPSVPEESTAAQPAFVEDPFANAEDPFASSQDPFASSEDPFANAEDPFAKAEDPFAKAGDPFANAKDPFANAEDPFAKAEDPFASSGGDPFSSSSSAFGEDPFASSSSNAADAFSACSDPFESLGGDPFASSAGNKDDGKEIQTSGDEKPAHTTAVALVRDESGQSSSILGTSTSVESLALSFTASASTQSLPGSHQGSSAAFPALPSALDPTLPDPFADQADQAFESLEQQESALTSGSSELFDTGGPLSAPINKPLESLKGTARETASKGRDSPTGATFFIGDGSLSNSSSCAELSALAFENPTAASAENAASQSTNKPPEGSGTDKPAASAIDPFADFTTNNTNNTPTSASAAKSLDPFADLFGDLATTPARPSSAMDPLQKLMASAGKGSSLSSSPVPGSTSEADVEERSSSAPPLGQDNKTTATTFTSADGGFAAESSAANPVDSEGKPLPEHPSKEEVDDASKSSEQAEQQVSLSNIAGNVTVPTSTAGSASCDKDASASAESDEVLNCSIFFIFF
jgi:hypothetical protein